ncbi:MAG: HEAT repeat domain-containing protein [Bacteroidota bacterium]
MSAYKPVSVQERDLVDARRSLRMTLGSAGPAQSLVERILDVFSVPLFPKYGPTYGTALAAAATLAVGIGLGYYFFGSSRQPEASGLFRTIAETEQADFNQGEAQVSNFRFVFKNEATGDIEFTFDATTPVRIKGNVKSDERVQKILARVAVSAENPGARLGAVSAIAGHSENALPIANEIKTALISVAKYDENRGVRAEALRALEKFLPDPEVVQAYVFVLKTEKNTGMKIAAITGLSKAKFMPGSMGQDLLDILKEKVQSDDNNYVRLRAQVALREAKQQ